MKVLASVKRIRFSNILLATDFSAAANAAAPYGAKIAEYYGSKLFVLYVRPPAINPNTQPASWRKEEEAARFKEEQQRGELLGMFPGLEPEIMIEDGDLWSNLNVAIEKNNIDLIVIGTRGRSGLGKLLLGSTAEEIFREAPCAVLTVGRNGEITRILFATDFSPESAAARYAVSLAQEYQAQLQLLHVIEDPKADELVRPADLAKATEQRLRSLIPEEAKLWCVPEYIVEQGKVAETILNVAAREKAELIVLGVRQPRGVPGAATHLSTATAHQVVSHAICPVLTIRGDVAPQLRAERAAAARAGGERY